MNFYDEEITISGSDNKPLSSVKVDSLKSASGSGEGGGGGGGRREQRASRQRNMLHGNSTDDDGLLQDIIDHDDDDDDDEADDSEDDDDDSELQLPMATQSQQSQQRPVTRPGSNRNTKLPIKDQVHDEDDDRGSSSDEATGMLPHLPQQQPHQQKRNLSGREHEMQMPLTPDRWESLSLHPELKELFPYILKYTPQSIETPCHLQPFIPEFVPAVGDVDAFLKVVAPPLLQPQRQQELDENLERLGLWLLDEPSGTQSEPSLLNMKLRSVLSGSRGRNSRNATSATLVPAARSAKDIDKWISEVEQVHIAQSMHDAQPRKDIDALLEDWPRVYAANGTISEVEMAYQTCLQDQTSLADYVRVLSEQFGIEGPLDTQIDYIHKVHTLFALYLAASQAWE